MGCFVRACGVVALVASVLVAADAAPTSPKAPAVPVVPWPRQVSVQAAHTVLGSEIGAADASLMPLARVLAEEIDATVGHTMRVVEKPGHATGDVVLAIDPELQSEQYRVAVDDDTIRIHGGSYVGVAHGTVTLLQMLDGRGDQGVVPHGTIVDHPEYGFRGLMVDVARCPHSIDTLESVVELCRLSKIRFLQVHLNDDQGWTFPSTAYPQLGTQNRKHVPRYSVAELTGLVRFADERGVTLIPEIDTPGHCGAAMRAAPEIFGTIGPDGMPRELHAMNIGSEKTYDALHTILGEVADIFASSPYIHIGCDEVVLSDVVATPEAKAYLTQHDLGGGSDLFITHINRMNTMVAALGKQAIVWESFRGDGSSHVNVSKDVIVMPWQNVVSTGPGLVERGFTIINASWSPLYVLRRTRFEVPEIYSWSPTTFGRPPNHGYNNIRWYHIDPTPKLLGGQISAWEQTEDILVNELRHRMAAMSERLWNPQADQPLASFEARLDACDNLVDRLITPVRIEADGLWNPDTSPHADHRHRVDHRLFEKAVTVTLSPVRPLRDGEQIHFTIDGSPVTADSPVYDRPFQLDEGDCRWAGSHEETVGVQARIFRDNKPVAYTSYAEYRYDSIATRPRTLHYTLYDVPETMTELPENTDTLKVIETGQAAWWTMHVLPRVRFPHLGEPFAAVFTGRVKLNQAGMYHLRLMSQSGRSQLFIDRELAVNRTKKHWSPTSADVPLDAGVHDIKLIYIGNGRHLKLTYAVDDDSEFKRFDLLPLEP